MKKIFFPFLLSCATSPQKIKPAIVTIEPEKVVFLENEDRQYNHEECSFKEKLNTVTAILDDYIKIAYLEEKPISLACAIGGYPDENSASCNNGFHYLNQYFYHEGRYLTLEYVSGDLCKTALNGKELGEKATTALILEFDFLSAGGVRMIDAQPFGSIDVVYALTEESVQKDFPASYYEPTGGVKDLYELTIGFLYEEFKRHPPRRGEGFGLSGNRYLNPEDGKKIKETMLKSLRDLEKERPIKGYGYTPCQLQK